MAVLSAEAADGADGPTLGGELVPAEPEATAEADFDLDISRNNIIKRITSEKFRNSR